MKSGPSLKENLQETFQITKKSCDALRDLVPFVQFKKHEKHPWRSVNFGKVAALKQLLLVELRFSSKMYYLINYNDAY